MLRVVSPLALVATLVVVAAGCGGDGASAPAADTTTTALRGQSTDITASSAASNPLLTFTALTTAPANGDTFSIT